MLIDSHAHLTYDPLEKDFDGVIFRAREAGIEAILNISTDPKGFERALVLCEKYPWIYQAAAVHPHDVEKHGAEWFDFLAAKTSDLVAIGETGLDYHYEHSSPEIQKIFLARHFALALETHLPVIIHCREGFEDLFTIADLHYRNGPAVLHCFTGSLQEAEKALQRGWMISLSGIVTFKKSEELREVAKIIPLSQLLIETDAPFLAPQSHRGKTNEPAFLVETAQVIADVKKISFEELAAATSANTRRLFDL